MVISIQQRGKTKHMLLKRKTLIGISIALVLVIALAVTLWGLFSPKRLTHVLPDEQVVRVAKVLTDETGAETETELSGEKIDSFIASLEDLSYTKYHNFRGIKTSVFDSVHYLITYEQGYTVKLSAHHLYVLHNGETETKLTLDGIRPEAEWGALVQLFE